MGDKQSRSLNMQMKYGRRYKRRYIFKAIGIELFSLLHTRKQDVEFPKVVVNSSFKLALLRCSVHVVPVLLCITLMALNLKHLYLGANLPGIIASSSINSGLLQVAAKISEVAIVGSMTAIIMHAIRFQLLAEKGLPLGAVGAPFLFPSFTYLWSPELWGSMLGKAVGSRWSKIALYSLLIVCTILAALVGPSSAVLLIPRQHDWKAGGAQIYLPGDSQYLYPEILPRAASTLPSVCSQSIATQIVFCPSGSFDDIVKHNDNNVFRSINAASYEFTATTAQELYAQGFGPAKNVVPVNQFWLRNMEIRFGVRGVPCQTGAVGFRFSEAMEMTGLTWKFNDAIASVPASFLQGSRAAYRWNNGSITSSSSKVPVVTTACSAAQNLSITGSQVSFPVIRRQDCWNTESSLNVSLSQTSSSSSRLTWQALPAEFGPTSTGLILETPWEPTGNTRLVLGCSISAGWSDGMTTTAAYDDGAFIGQPYNGTPWNRSYDGDSVNTPDSSWQLLTMNKEWLDLVAVTTNDSDENAPTSLDLLLGQYIMQGLGSTEISMEQIWNQGGVGAYNRTTAVEGILAYLFADALSRESMIDVLAQANNTDYYTWGMMYSQVKPDFNDLVLDDNNPMVAPNISPLSNIPVTIYISGLAFMAEAATDYASLGVLSVYIILALAHTVYLLFINRESSGCWDTITELITLAYNSQPSPTALKNTGAGIKELRTYGKRGMIRSTSERTASSSIPKVELIFKEDWEDREEGTTRTELESLSHSSSMANLDETLKARVTSRVENEELYS